MTWKVQFHKDFAKEFSDLDAEVKTELRALVEVLKIHGPSYGRPRVDTLNDSKHANMKEIRFDAADGVWRVAFAFDPKRNAILLVAGDKSGVRTTRFYKKIIKLADKRFDSHLSELNEKEKEKK
ncbi:type II toxin-antitoxin system RelE/ParE family toxin [uncultured Roseibium sp.]|uniref:type II toxin-antitoxin system RelE/ParE family toxin n=1 Tax=uncultured Roseibium sp. TaxID=1936171 RepID=UPI002621C70A|nr:type II toxin-antitoxin system RelE/ParE family toxin [uncultured Roseibium sp.]